ncbi:MAG: hypothetical protein EOO02_25005 [Chitinophagaceae bacterium]|nr:MAG: hypothetical protein EOO02_25005 [Chitinophagaceae bacterium]
MAATIMIRIMIADIGREDLDMEIIRTTVATVLTEAIFRVTPGMVKIIMTAIQEAVTTMKGAGTNKRVIMTNVGRNHKTDRTTIRKEIHIMETRVMVSREIANRGTIEEIRTDGIKTGMTGINIGTMGVNIGISNIVRTGMISMTVTDTITAHKMNGGEINLQETIQIPQVHMALRTTGINLKEMLVVRTSIQQTDIIREQEAMIFSNS